MSFNVIKRFIPSISLFLFIPLTVMAGEPTERIRIVSDRLISIISDSALLAPEMAEKREQMIMETVNSVFDWEEFSRRALARHWAKRTDQEKREFVSLFGRLVKSAYMGKTRQYSDVSVQFTDEKIEGAYSKVSTNVITSSGTQIPFEYRMIKKNGTWWVYDVYIEGVSLVNNYRSQFNSILARSSYEDLVKRLKEKVDESE
jgi:phospholipid transport system substrate-binding protein